MTEIFVVILANVGLDEFITELLYVALAIFEKIAKMILLGFFGKRVVELQIVISNAIFTVSFCVANPAWVRLCLSFCLTLRRYRRFAVA